MIIVLIVLLLLIIGAFLLLFSDFLVILSVSESQLSLKIRMLHLTFRIPLGEKNKEKPKKEKKKPKQETSDSVMKRFLEMRNQFTRIREALGTAFRYLSHKIEMKESGVVGKFGLGNPAVTGITYGTVEAFAGVVTGFLQHFFKFEKPPYRNITMDYNNVVFELKFALLMKTKLIYLIKAAIIFWKHWKH